ncbi:MAG: glycosyltransferase family A protein [Methylococcales bacterium]|nr:glycosyltransferase family A protein [Methylococcales bacterium]
MTLYPLVSICIPTHNQNPIFLKKCIESAIQQTYKNIEIIINNNNTTNESLSYLKSLSEEMGSIIQISTNESTITMMESFEQAIQNATGDYLFMLPSDDFIEKNAIEVLVDALQQNPDADCISGQWRFVDKEFNQVGIKKNQLYYENKERQIYDSLELKNNYFTSSIIRSEYLKNMDLSLNKKIKYAFDIVFSVEATLHGKVVVIDNIISNFQSHNPRRKGRQAESIIDDSTNLNYFIREIFEDKNLKNKISKIKIAKIIVIHTVRRVASLIKISLKLAITPAILIDSITYLVKMSLSSMSLLI